MTAPVTIEDRQRAILAIIELPAFVPCPRCDGVGSYQDDAPAPGRTVRVLCDECGGDEAQHG